MSSWALVTLQYAGGGSRATAVHIGTNSKPVFSFSCDRCSFKCPDPESLQVHMTRHDDGVTSRPPQAHMTATHLCEICGWGFREKENLVRHRRSHARAIQAGAAGQKCKFCGQGFVNNKILMRHIIVNHEAQQMAFIEKSLHSAGVENSTAATDDCRNIDPVKPEEAVVTFAKKAVTLPHLLAPGFFHPTLKQCPGLAGAEKELKLRARKIVITNSAALKDSDYTIKLPEDGSRVVKILTSRKKTVY